MACFLTYSSNARNSLVRKGAELDLEQLLPELKTTLATDAATLSAEIL